MPSNSSFVQRLRCVQFHPQIEVLQEVSPAYFPADAKASTWYSREEFASIKAAVEATVHEMRKAQNSKEKLVKRKRGLCSRGLEHLRSSAHEREHELKISSVVSAVLEEQKRQRGGALKLSDKLKEESNIEMAERIRQVSENMSRQCRAYAVEKASKDALFVQEWNELPKTDGNRSIVSSLTSDVPPQAQRRRCVQFHPQVTVFQEASPAYFPTNTKDSTWYSREEFESIMAAVKVTIHEMRKAQNAKGKVAVKKRGLCSRGLEHLQSSARESEHEMKISSVVSAVLKEQRRHHSTSKSSEKESNAELLLAERLRHVSEKLSRQCRVSAFELASKDALFVQEWIGSPKTEEDCSGISSLTCDVGRPVAQNATQSR